MAVRTCAPTLHTIAFALAGFAFFAISLIKRQFEVFKSGFYRCQVIKTNQGLPPKVKRHPKVDDATAILKSDSSRKSDFKNQKTVYQFSTVRYRTFNQIFVSALQSSTISWPRGERFINGCETCLERTTGVFAMTHFDSGRFGERREMAG